MYEVPDIQDYRRKWLEAERDLALYWVEPLSTPLINSEPTNDAEKDIAPISKAPSVSRKLEDYQPGATKTQVFFALKRVAKTSQQPSARHGKRPVSTS